MNAWFSFVKSNCAEREGDGMTENGSGVRERVVRWHDPMEAAQQVATMSGLEALQAMQRGDVPAPPIGELMGIRGVEVEEGRAVVAVEPAEFHANNTGAAHGGLAATLLDSAMWLALHSTMPAGSFCSTVQMNLHYVRPLQIGAGEVTAEGRVVHRGRRTGTAEGTITDAGGKVLVHGSTSCVVFGL
jgi:uncharacterized protein (TIGR00369 family)